MRTLALGPALRQELADKGRRRALAEFALEAVVRRYEELYERLMARRNRKRHNRNLTT